MPPSGLLPRRRDRASKGCECAGSLPFVTRRLVRALLVMLALTAFAGCEVTGSVDVRSADAVAVDLTVKGDDYYLPCDSSNWGAAGKSLGFNEFVDDRGETTCRVFGTIHPELVRDMLQVSQPGEYLEAASNPLSMAPGKEIPIGSVWSSARTKLDVTVTFPGRVLSSTGEADGNKVHFGDPKQYVRPFGLRATALGHPGPEWSVLGPIVGVGVGIGLAVLWWYLRRQRRRATRLAGAPIPDPGADDAGQPDQPPDPDQGDDHEPQVLTTELVEPGLDPPPASGVPPTDPDPSESVWARPGRQVTDAPTAVDDSRWAPPQP